MGGYAVDPAELHRADAQLAGCAAQARTALAGLATAAHAVFGVVWQGPAAADFRQGWHDWHAGAVAAVDALDELASAVGLSGRNYDGTEAAVVTTIARASA